MRSRRPVLPRFGGALKTRPKATEIKVTFVPEEYLEGWGSGGRVPGLLSPHMSNHQRRDGLPSAPRPLLRGSVSRSVQPAQEVLTCARSQAPLQVGTITTRVYQWGN